MKPESAPVIQSNTIKAIKAPTAEGSLPESRQSTTTMKKTDTAPKNPIPDGSDKKHAVDKKKVKGISPPISKPFSKILNRKTSKIVIPVSVRNATTVPNEIHLITV